MSDPWRPHLHLPAILVVAFMCAWISNTLAGPSRRLSWRPAPSRPMTARGELPPPTPELVARFPADPGRPESDIDGEGARWLHAHGALFLDARRSADYLRGHVSGARSLSPWEDGLPAKLEELAALVPDPKAPVVVYCAGGGCPDSRLLAQKLWIAGFRNLRVYEGGFPEWEARGGAVTKGELP